MSTQSFSESITFSEGCDHGLRAGYRLANWPDNTWVVEGDVLHQRRSRCEELAIRLAYRKEHYGDGPSWIKIPRAPFPALVAGDRQWGDYSVRAEVRVDGGRAGLAVRWEDARHCYVLFLENGTDLALYRRIQEELIELARASFVHSADAFYTLTVEARGSELTCSVVDGPTLTVMDDHYPAGGVALFAETPAAYKSLAVEGTMTVSPAPTLPAEITPVLQASFPLPTTEPATTLRPMLRQIGGEPAIVLRPNEGRELLIVGPDGAERLRLGPWDEAPDGPGDVVLQIFDVNNDGLDEVMLVTCRKLHVYSLTGELLACQDVPPPNAYGECANDPDWAAVDDAMCPVHNMAGETLGFYLKDRYWNIHFYDTSLTHKWHHAVNTGHYPFPVDVDGDGREEILCCHTLFDVDGNVRWKVSLPDHVDGIAYRDFTGRGERKLLHLMAGEAGAVTLDPATGEVLRQFIPGHAQNCLMGQFIAGSEAWQILVDTLWCEPNIHYLLDDQLRELARWELCFPDGAPAPYALPWGERDLMVNGMGAFDPFTGQRFVAAAPWANDERLVDQWVLDWPGMGPSRLVQLREDRIDIWAPADESVIRRPSPLPHVFSGYLPR
jgi:rhamnogalacturonan endolyase